MHLLETPAPCARCHKPTTRCYHNVPLCILCRMQQVKASLPAYGIRQPEPGWKRLLGRLTRRV